MDLFNSSVPTVTVRELKQKKDQNAEYFLLDVRNPDEFETANIGGTLIPMSQITDKTEDIPRDKPVIIHCHHGGRSAKVCEFLINQGFDNVANLEGGIDAWSIEIDNNIPRY